METDIIDRAAAAAELEALLRKRCRTPEEERSLEVRPSQRFYPYNSHKGRALEVFLGDRVTCVDIPALEKAIANQKGDRFVELTWERLKERQPHPTERFTWRDVLAEEVDLLWGILADRWPAEDLEALQARIEEELRSFFPASYTTGKALRAVHQRHIRSVLRGELVTALAVAIEATAEPQAKAGKPAKKERR